MLHLGSGLLQEYGLWQLFTAACFFLTGLLIEGKCRNSIAGKVAALVGTLLCADELLMLHECFDHLYPHIFLVFEFAAAAFTGFQLWRSGFFSWRPLSVVALLSTAALGAELNGKGQGYVYLEESLEVVCALLGLSLASLAKGPVDLKGLAVRTGFWSVLGLAFGVLVLNFRPQVCPTVDEWSKRYFHEQIW